MNQKKSSQSAIIMGAGPAGLTAAIELLKIGIHPTLIEKSTSVGGIAKTITYKGNRLDIGGHRFFSKSDRIMDWWQKYFPVFEGTDQELANAPNTIMLVRNRRSSIYYAGQFFDYPLIPTPDTLRKLGYLKALRIGTSYVKSLLKPRAPVKSLEDFFINRFGYDLYNTFFKSYTEKVWGVKCSEIDPSWGEQRVKGLSMLTALYHSLIQNFWPTKGIRQKQTETSLIEKFLYPKHGPGSFWDAIAKEVIAKGGTIRTRHRIECITMANGKVDDIEITNIETGESSQVKGEYFFSTIPVKEFIPLLKTEIPPEIKNISDGLSYRHFITVGVLVKKSRIINQKISEILSMNNWIYIQEPNVKMGRIQVMNNWSPFMVADPSTYLLGIEFFSGEGEPLWALSPDEIQKCAAQELEQLGFCRQQDILDAFSIKMPNAYPGYINSYQYFGTVRSYLDGIDNLYLIGRNGTHRYNNQDHAMLTAITAVENIVNGRKDKSNIWSINTEHYYHEQRKTN